MNTKTVRNANILAAVMLLLYAGCTLLNLFVYLVTQRTIYVLPSGLLLCLSVIAPCIVLLIHGIEKAGNKQGKLDVVLSILTLAVCSVWSLGTLISWETSTVRNVIVESCDQTTMTPSLEKVVHATTDIILGYNLFITLVALFLLVVCIISVLRAKQKLLQFKAELHKIAGAGVLLTAAVVYVVNRVLSTAMFDQGAAAYQTYSTVSTYCIFGIQVLATLVAIVLVVTLGMNMKKQELHKEA